MNDIEGEGATMPEKLSVLVVEDEQIIALDLAAAVEEAGCNVVGPVGTVREALALIDDNVGAAILDITLRDGDVVPVANLLNRRRIPCVVQTGGGFPFRIKNEMPDALVFFKPVSSTRLVHYLLALAASRASAVRNAA
jgi:DNA-binding NtrC family response regulator